MPDKNDKSNRDINSVVAALTEQIYLRDVLLLITTAANPYDRKIVEWLMGMSETKTSNLEPGQWQHIFEEAARLKLPEAHAKTMERLFERLNRPPQA